MSENMTCRTCGKELPATSFPRTRWGGYMTVCRVCQAEAKRATRASRRAKRARFEGGDNPLNNMTFPEFEGKEPREVIAMMTRAKAWLEQQGYDIKLSGEFRKIKIIPIKFEL